MSAHRYDVVGIGNAIVDVISQETEQFVVDHDLVKGAMTLIDAERATQLYDAMAPAIETSGGSAASWAGMEGSECLLREPEPAKSQLA